MNEESPKIVRQGSDTSWRPGSLVATVLIGTNSIYSLGLKHILADTCFVVVEQFSEERATLSDLSDTDTLFILGTGNDSHGAGEAVKNLKAEHPTARVVVLADHLEVVSVLAAYHSGADGVCLATASRDVLVKSLELVMLGESIFPSAVARMMHDKFLRCSEPKLRVHTAASDSKIELEAYGLSPRESEILECLMQGASDKAIAQRLDISEVRTKSLVKTIIKRLGVANRTQVAIWAIKHLPRHQITLGSG